MVHRILDYWFINAVFTWTDRFALSAMHFKRLKTGMEIELENCF